MTFYRGDVQYAIPLDHLPSGFYWCTQVHYFNAGTSGEYEACKDTAMRVTAEGLNVNCILWYQLWREWPSAVVVERTNEQRDHPYLSGPYGPIENTVYMALLNGTTQVGFKRIRSPLRYGDIIDGFLEASVYDYYQTTMQGLYEANPRMTNYAGVSITGVRVRREVSGWQLRHGTKRVERQRITYP